MAKKQTVVIPAEVRVLFQRTPGQRQHDKIISICEREDAGVTGDSEGYWISGTVAAIVRAVVEINAESTLPVIVGIDDGMSPNEQVSETSSPSRADQAGNTDR